MWHVGLTKPKLGNNKNETLKQILIQEHNKKTLFYEHAAHCPPRLARSDLVWHGQRQQGLQIKNHIFIFMLCELLKYEQW